MATFRTLRSIFRGIKTWFNQAPFALKITIGLIITGATSFVAIFFEDFEPLAESPPWIRLGVIIFLFVSLFWSLIALWERGERTDSLSKARAELEEKLRNVESELKQLQQEKETLLQVDEIIWERPDYGQNRFLPIDDRKTVIVSIINLKGGVGKTTLTANLAACFATMNQPLRVLTIDLDFQGTLSDMCVEQSTLTLLRKTHATVGSLLQPDSTLDDLSARTVAMTNISGASLVCAHDRLDTIDFRLQAQFYLDQEKEVRFYFQRLLHCKELNNSWDLILFDCPPRLTTSTINALTCSDFVLIPTKLDRSSVTAVPRTLKWLVTMGKIAQAQPIGIIANETISRGTNLIKHHKNSYENLKDLIPKLYRDRVMENTVPFSNKIAHTGNVGVVASIDNQVRDLFLPVAVELRGRLGI